MTENKNSESYNYFFSKGKRTMQSADPIFRFIFTCMEQYQSSKIKGIHPLFNFRNVLQALKSAVTKNKPTIGSSICYMLIY